MYLEYPCRPKILQSNGFTSWNLQKGPIYCNTWYLFQIQFSFVNLEVFHLSADHLNCIPRRRFFSKRPSAQAQRATLQRLIRKSIGQAVFSKLLDDRFWRVLSQLAKAANIRNPRRYTVYYFFCEMPLSRYTSSIIYQNFLLSRGE